MTTISSTHRSRGLPRRHREHPEGTLAVTVLIGALGLAWFVIHVWMFVTHADALP